MELIKNKKLDLKQDKVSKIFWIYAIPSIIAMIAQSTAGLIDSIFIGRFVGPNGLSAITLIFPVVMLLSGVATMVAIGGTTLSGIYKGAGDENKSNNFFNVTTALLCIISIIGTILMLSLSSFLPKLFNVDMIVGNYIKDYISTLSIFFLPFMLCFAFTFFLKLDGKPASVVVMIISGTFINIILDYLFVGLLKWAMLGAALATGLSQLLPCLMMLYYIRYKSNWKFKLPIFRKQELKDMLFNGSSEFLSVAAGSITGLIMNSIILSKIGVRGVAAYAVALQVGSLAIAVFYGFAESIQSPVSVNIGGGNISRVRKFKLYSLVSNLTIGIILLLACFVFGKGISGLFLSDRSIIEISSYILKFYAFSFILAGINITLATYYTSVNSPKISALLALSRSFVGTVIGLLILPPLFGDSGIWASLIFCEIFTFIIGAYFVYKLPFGDNYEKIKPPVLKECSSK